MRDAASVALLLLLLAGPAQAQDPFAQDPFSKAMNEYDASIQCKSLYRRTIGIEAFAKTRDDRAYKLLTRRYAQPEEPGLHIRYLVATSLQSALAGEEVPKLCEEVLTDLLKKHKKPIDGWLHRCIYGVQATTKADWLHSIAADKRAKPHARAAAVLALADAKDAGLLAAIPQLLSKESLPKKGSTRLLLIEACARALGEYADQERETLRPAAEAVIAQFDAKKTDERAKVVLGRLLQRALKTARPMFDAVGWSAFLNGKQPAEAPGPKQTRVRASFFSVLASGRNVGYVIDLSDSMLEPLGEAEIEKLRKAMPEEAETDTFAKNRFEATKLLLAKSLQGLVPSQSFAIVGFGSYAELLTPGMLKASPANVKKAIQGLESLVVGQPATDRPHGTLKGWTNLYGGLRLAFKVKKKGSLETDDEYVAEDCFEEGCDTIFLLSDGEPSWSDFEGWDPALPDDTVGDGEGGGGTNAAQGEEIQYYGPHMMNRFLYADLERLNTYRNVQIHSIGIGEADPELLQTIARIGNGACKLFGSGED